MSVRFSGETINLEAAKIDGVLNLVALERRPIYMLGPYPVTFGRSSLERSLIASRSSR
jgi:hypothetical protein